MNWAVVAMAREGHIFIVKLVAWFIPVPFGAHWVISQALPATAMPDLRGLLDFGVTALLAVAGLWIYSKQVTSWQAQFTDLAKLHSIEMGKLAETHIQEMSRLADRYEKQALALADRSEGQTNKLLEVISANMVVKGQLLDAIRDLSKVRFCAYAEEIESRRRG
jgi:hypothetical protein